MAAVATKRIRSMDDLVNELLTTNNCTAINCTAIIEERTDTTTRFTTSDGIVGAKDISRTFEMLEDRIILAVIMNNRIHTGFGSKVLDCTRFAANRLMDMDDKLARTEAEKNWRLDYMTTSPRRYSSIKRTKRN